jgi:uncharacterized membrane protein
VRHFSVRPALTMRGRKFHGLRGWGGKPFHPPLTDIPVAAYVLAAAFDVISLAGGHRTWAREFWHAGTFVFVAGAAVSVLAATTGFFDWLRSTEPGNQARRTANTHAVVMVTVTVLALADVVLRLRAYDDPAPVAVVVLSVVVAALVSFGALFGGALVYDYGFNVETAGDSPVWHRSEVDVRPGHKQ